MIKLKSRLIIGLAVLTLTTSVFADTKTDYDQAIQYAKQILEENYDFSCNTDEKMTEVEYDGIIGYLDKEGNPIGEWKSKDKTDRIDCSLDYKKNIYKVYDPSYRSEIKGVEFTIYGYETQNKYYVLFGEELNFEEYLFSKEGENYKFEKRDVFFFPRPKNPLWKSFILNQIHLSREFKRQEMHMKKVLMFIYIGAKKEEQKNYDSVPFIQNMLYQINNRKGPVHKCESDLFLLQSI